MFKWQTGKPRCFGHELTTNPLVFIINDKMYYGHFHTNGFFYKQERTYATLIGKHNTTKWHTNEFNNTPIVIKWAFFDSYSE